MTTPAMLGATLDIALNRLLGRDPDVRARLARLSGRSVRAEVSGLLWRFDLLIADGGRIVVLTDGLDTVDVAVRGPLPGLVRLALRDGHAEWPQGVEVDGDAELLDQLRRIVAGAGLDVEELLAGALGGAAAHRVAQGLRGAFGWGRSSLRTLGLDAAEYLREETYTLARRRDADAFTQEVEALRDATARLDARLRRLEARVAPRDDDRDATVTRP